MIDSPVFLIVDSAHPPAARCVVCGGETAEGEGFTARYRERTLRLKCSDCVSRFRADPDRYLAGHADGCCSESHPRGSPASEWACD
jgi:hypothetical protein